MGPKYNVATDREELGCTTIYWRSKRHSKRAKVPNLGVTCYRHNAPNDHPYGYPMYLGLDHGENTITSSWKQR